MVLAGPPIQVSALIPNAESGWLSVVSCASSSCAQNAKFWRQRTRADRCGLRASAKSFASIHGCDDRDLVTRRHGQPWEMSDAPLAIHDYPACLTIQLWYHVVVMT